LTGINAPRIEDFRMPLDGLLAELKEILVTAHRVEGFAIHYRDRPGIAPLIRIQPRDQAIKRAEVRVIARVPEWINDYWMDSNSGGVPRRFAVAMRVGRFLQTCS